MLGLIICLSDVVIAEGHRPVQVARTYYYRLLFQSWIAVCRLPNEIACAALL
jgi:hypothetical protein